jgi:disulfide bond formation protein DsbB
MEPLSVWLAPRWAWLALLASAAMLAAAHSFERFGGLAPCALCLQQRDVYWGAMVLSTMALLVLRYRPDPARRRIASILLGLVFLVSAGVAAYHVAVEQHWVIAQCDAARPDDIAVMGSGGFEAPRCDTPAWTMFGVSMAGYNALISLGLAALSFLAARGVKA